MMATVYFRHDFVLGVEMCDHNKHGFYYLS